MSELDDFRPRIRNWARVYRDRFMRFESNLMTLIRALKRLDAVPTEEPRQQPDYKDAEFLDGCILRLRKTVPDFEGVFPVLKAEYLTRYSNETFENEQDAQKARRSRARYADVFAWRYDEELGRAESLLMNAVKKKEQTAPLA